MKKLIAGFAAMAFTVVATVALAQMPAPPANDPRPDSAYDIVAVAVVRGGGPIGE